MRPVLLAVGGAVLGAVIALMPVVAGFVAHVVWTLVQIGWQSGG